MIVFKKSNLM